MKNIKNIFKKIVYVLKYFLLFWLIMIVLGIIDGILIGKLNWYDIIFSVFSFKNFFFFFGIIYKDEIIKFLKSIFNW